MDKQVMEQSIRTLYREISDGTGYANKERFIAWYADQVQQLSQEVEELEERLEDD